MDETFNQYVRRNVEESQNQDLTEIAKNATWMDCCKWEQETRSRQMKQAGEMYWGNKDFGKTYDPDNWGYENPNKE